MIQDYNTDVLAANVREKAVQQNVEQQHIYDNVMRTVDEGTGGLFFIYAPGGYVVLNLCILSRFFLWLIEGSLMFREHTRYVVHERVSRTSAASLSPGVEKHSCST